VFYKPSKTLFLLPCHNNNNKKTCFTHEGKTGQDRNLVILKDTVLNNHTLLASSSDPGATGNISAVALVIQWFNWFPVNFHLLTLVSSGISVNFHWDFTEFSSGTWVIGNQWPFTVSC